MRRVCAMAAGALVLVGGAAHAATQPLPIIVTYEMQRERDAARSQRRDPKTFWIRQIVARIEDNKPTGTLGLEKPATVGVSFTVARDGRIVAKAIATTSGVPAVDTKALAMLERAQPFPPMPEAMSESDLAFTLPLRFR